MTDKDKMIKPSNGAVKNEAVELDDDDLDVLSGGAKYDGIDGFTRVCNCKIRSSVVDHKADDIAFIKGETIPKK
jgi:hypothetical protein